MVLPLRDTETCIQNSSLFGLHTLRAACLCLPSAGIKGVRHHLAIIHSYPHTVGEGLGVGILVPCFLLELSALPDCSLRFNFLPVETCHVHTLRTLLSSALPSVHKTVKVSEKGSLKGRV